MDNRRVALLGLVDLSAAFDCVDDDVLPTRYQSKFGFDGLVLSWIKSFIRDRTRRVSFRRQVSVDSPFLFDVAQVSVLGLLLFILYTAELFDLIAEFGCTANSYADDTQVYLSTAAVDATVAVEQLITCIEQTAD
jgi:hypothetical protein